MKEVIIRLNDFLFNSGILGFYNVLENANKLNLLKFNGNVMSVEIEAFENFAEDYFSMLMEQFETDTRWYSLVSKKEELKNLNLNNQEDIVKFENYLKNLVETCNSNSYKAGHEILKNENIVEDVNNYLTTIKKEKDNYLKRDQVLKIIEYMKKYKEVYCMKDIMYTKINPFWGNKSFLYSQANKKNIRSEYIKCFIDPLKKYLQKEQNSEFCCMECGNKVKKTDAMNMAWIRVGIDISRKTSAFWNFNEDSFLCPVCSLVYSCIPLGFNIINSEGIFVNNNESIFMLKGMNNDIKSNIEINEEASFQNICQKVFLYLLNSGENIINQKRAENEVKNIQVVRNIRQVIKSNVFYKYEFNIIPKNKLKVFGLLRDDFRKLIGKSFKVGNQSKDISKAMLKTGNEHYINIYDEVINNFFENKKQYGLINEAIRYSIKDNIKINYILYIIKIQLNCIGGINVEEMQKEINKMQYAGKTLKLYFGSESENKLKTYIFNLNNSLRVNNVNLFMETITRMYCGLGKDIPNAYGFAKMLNSNDEFKLLGYAYILGLKQEIENKEEIK